MKKLTRGNFQRIGMIPHKPTGTTIVRFFAYHNPRTKGDYCTDEIASYHTFNDELLDRFNDCDNAIHKAAVDELIEEYNSAKPFEYDPNVLIAAQPTTLDHSHIINPDIVD